MLCHQTHAPCTSATVRCHARGGSILKHARLRLSGRYRTQLDTRRVRAVARSHHHVMQRSRRRPSDRRLWLLVRTAAVAAGKGPARGAFQCIELLIE
jgi:hypothetical protein